MKFKKRYSMGSEIQGNFTPKSEYDNSDNHKIKTDETGFQLKESVGIPDMDIQISETTSQLGGNVNRSYVPVSDSELKEMPNQKESPIIMSVQLPTDNNNTSDEQNKHNETNSDLTENTDDKIRIGKHISINKTIVIRTIKVCLFLLYMVYFVYCMTVERLHNESSWRLLICTILSLYIYSSRYTKKSKVCHWWRSIRRSKHFRSGSRLRYFIRW